MRSAIYFFLSVSIGTFFSCKPKNGVHEIVRFHDENKATDDIYIRYLTEQIDQYPEEEDNYIKLASIYKNQRSEVKAVKLLERAEKHNPTSLNILFNLAELYLQDEYIEKLSASLNAVRKIDPDNVKFLKLSGGYALLLEDYTNAIFFSNRALLANPYDNENYYLRGCAQLIHNDSLNALISLEEAYKLKNSYKNFSKVFEVALALGDVAKARSYIDKFSVKKPDLNLCYEWGAYFNETGHSDTSRQILMNCKKSKPDEFGIYLELAKNYSRANNIDSTLRYVNQFLGTEPKGTEGYVLKARTLEKINYYSEARKMYKAALEIDSTSTLAQRGLENLERKVAYLRLIKRKEEVQRQVETLKPLNSKEIN